MWCVSSGSRLSQFFFQAATQSLSPQGTLLLLMCSSGHFLRTTGPLRCHGCQLPVLHYLRYPSSQPNLQLLWPAYVCAVRREPLVPGVCSGPAGDDEGASGSRGVGCPGVQEPDTSAGGAWPQRLPLRQGNRKYCCSYFFNLSFGVGGAEFAPFLQTQVYRYIVLVCGVTSR